MRYANKLFGTIIAISLASSVLAAPADKKTTFTNPKQAGPDFQIQGEYEGTIGNETKVGAQVIALGDGKFSAVLYAKGLPGAGWDGKTKVPLVAQNDRWSGEKVIARSDAKLHVENKPVADARLGEVLDVSKSNGPWLWISSKRGWIHQSDVVAYEAMRRHYSDSDATGITFVGKNFRGEIKDGLFSGVAEENVKFEMKKAVRKSPTLGAKPPKGAIVLFDGTSADAWENGRLTEHKLLMVGTRTKQKFNNFTLHLEFRTPFMPYARGQGRGNSGMYLLDQYECQILDSFGLTGEYNECGGIYRIARPKVNMCLPPLSWQTYDVEFTAARFNAVGKKIAPAVVTIRHNGVVIHDKLQLPRSTPGGRQNDENPPGALFLQDHRNPVHIRNIWIVEKK